MQKHASRPSRRLLPRVRLRDARAAGSARGKAVRAARGGHARADTWGAGCIPTRTRDLGFAIERADGPELLAIRGTGDGTRDRARVSASGALLQIDLRTELQDSNGTWLRAGRVCAEYAHVRERVLAAQILKELGGADGSQG